MEHRQFRQRTRSLAGTIVSRALRWGLGLPGVSTTIVENLSGSFMRGFPAELPLDPEIIRQALKELSAQGFMPTGGILGYHEYLAAMQAGKFRVGPLPERYIVPGKPEGESPFGATTITLGLGATFVGLIPNKIIDLQRRSLQSYLSDNDYSFRTVLRTGDKVAILPTGQTADERAQMLQELKTEYGDTLKLTVVGFINGETHQTVEFPLPEKGELAYAGFVTNLTRIARFGVDNEKAPRLHTGDCHRITLEFENSGPDAFMLTVGEQPIANLTVVPVIGAPAESTSTIRGQSGPSGVPMLQPLHSSNGAAAVLLPT